ncbi:MAG: acetate/propionate family kinase [Candidatus Binatia bacterium]
MKLLTVNCGSSSIKLKVFDAATQAVLAAGLLERLGEHESHWQQRRRREDGTFAVTERTARVTDHRAGFAFIIGANAGDPVVTDESELLGIAHRVVHGGEAFRSPALVSDAVIAGIRDLEPLAPLHNPFSLLGMEIARERFPHVPQVAIFDTAFHHTLPPHAFHYALPTEAHSQHAIRRYGFHGTSHEYVARAAARHLGQRLEQTSLITLHLGNGASAAAIQCGRSIDTSMGLTPLEGLVMGSRCGDLDPAIPFYLMRRAGEPADRVEALLNEQSGLKGLCGSNDMREIQQRVRDGDARAGLALDVYCYRLKKYIGAYHAVLGRVDAVVFTGGIGENSALVRQRACAGLEHLGIRVDEMKNETAAAAVAEIQPAGEGIKVLVIRTDEELEMARQAIAVISRAGDSRAGV